MITKKDLKIGQDITLVSKGIRQSYGTSYVVESNVGIAHFFRVTKLGTTYVYGKYQHKNDSGVMELTLWEDKIDPAEWVLFDGLREDLKQAFLSRQALREAYEKLRTDTRRDIERKHSDLARAELDEWDKANPRPKPLDLTALPY